MGGKTGTAQKAGRDGVNYLVSFIGFAPVDDPQLVIYCVVDEPNAVEQYHSSFAQNIVREILEEVLPYMNIYRDEQTTGIHAGWDITGTDTGATAMTGRCKRGDSGGKKDWMCRTQRIPCREMKRRRKAQTRRRIAETRRRITGMNRRIEETPRRITEISHRIVETSHRITDSNNRHNLTKG